MKFICDFLSSLVFKEKKNEIWLSHMKEARIL